MVNRPSLKNFTDVRWHNHETIFFNSHDISSGDCTRTNLTTVSLMSFVQTLFFSVLFVDFRQNLLIFLRSACGRVKIFYQY